MATVNPQVDEAAFFVALSAEKDGNTVIRSFQPTIHTESPWAGGGFQHGSPPAALVAVNLESAARDLGLDMERGRFQRMTVELLGAVPLTELRCATRIVRPGKRINYLETVATDESGREVLRGTGWWLLTDSTTDIERVVAEDIPGPEHGTRADHFLDFWKSGYIDAIEVLEVPRSQKSLEHGSDHAAPIDNVYWSRSDFPVVLGEEDTPWVQLMKTADIANGLNRILDPKDWMWMNVDMSVYLHRLPQGEWLGHLSEVNYGTDGIGTTVSRIYDTAGPIGTTNQGIMLTRLKK